MSLELNWHDSVLVRVACDVEEKNDLDVMNDYIVPLELNSGGCGR